jgi:hypothetical protein
MAGILLRVGEVVRSPASRKKNSQAVQGAVRTESRGYNPGLISCSEKEGNVTPPKLCCHAVSLSTVVIDIEDGEIDIGSKQGLKLALVIEQRPNEQVPQIRDHGAHLHSHQELVLDGQDIRALKD